MFKFNDYVSVKTGFYAGCTGTCVGLVEGSDPARYYVRLTAADFQIIQDEANLETATP